MNLGEKGADGYDEKLRLCHQRGATRLMDLCFRNGGIYIKLGQHIGQLVSMPVSPLACLLSARLPKPCHVVLQVPRGATRGTYSTTALSLSCDHALLINHCPPGSPPPQGVRRDNACQSSQQVPNQ